MDGTNQNVPLPEIPQGADYTQVVEYVNPDGDPVDLTDYTAQMQFRETVESTGNPVISLSTGSGSIVIDGTLGTVTLTIPHLVTSTSTPGQKLYYDLFIYDTNGIATRLLAGTVCISGSVTR